MQVTPLLVEFVAGTRLYREAAFTTGLPIVGNGPPGTFVIFPGGQRVPLPTDQIVLLDDHGGCARVGFFGMRFAGQTGPELVFHRVKEHWPASQLSPERGFRMTLLPAMVAAILVDGQQVWPEPALLN